jgi:hypothetical protein
MLSRSMLAYHVNEMYASDEPPLTAVCMDLYILCTRTLDLAVLPINLISNPISTADRHPPKRW